MKQTAFLLGAGAFLLGATSDLRAATVLSGTSRADNAAIESDYGSRLAGTPGVSLTWTPSGSSVGNFEGWQAYASWTNLSPINTTGTGVYQMGNGKDGINYDILFTPDAGITVILQSVDINIYSGGNSWVMTAAVLNADASEQFALFSMSPGEGNTTYSLGDYSGEPGQELLLRFNIQTVGRSGGYIAMDNLTFDQIPEPGAALIGGLGLLGLLRRRRS